MIHGDDDDFEDLSGLNEDVEPEIPDIDASYDESDEEQHRRFYERGLNVPDPLDEDL